MQHSLQELEQLSVNEKKELLDPFLDHNQTFKEEVKTSLTFWNNSWQLHLLCSWSVHRQKPKAADIYFPLNAQSSV